MHCCQANQRLKRPTGGTDTLLLKRRFLLLPCLVLLYYTLLAYRLLLTSPPTIFSFGELSLDTHYQKNEHAPSTGLDGKSRATVKWLQAF